MRETVAVRGRYDRNFLEMKKMPLVPFRVLATVGFLAAAGAGLSGCNTVAGMGKDASAVGHDVSKGATATQGAVTSNTGLASH